MDTNRHERVLTACRTGVLVRANPTRILEVNFFCSHLDLPKGLSTQAVFKTE